MNRTKFVLLCFAGIVGLLLGVWRPVQRHIFTKAVQEQAAPSVAALEEFMERASDPGAAIRVLWNTGRIPQRGFAMEYLQRHRDLAAALPDILQQGAEDIDFTVRETALLLMADRNQAEHAAAARAQLSDADPELRLLGLQQLKTQSPDVATPIYMRMIEDPEPKVAATASVFLQGVSGRNVGLKVSDSIEGAGIDFGPKLDQARREWMGWWAGQTNYRGLPHIEPRPSRPALAPPPEFTLPDLEGRNVALTDLRGKVVLLNFWATWCPVSRAEIPGLVELQAKFPEQLAILGISLDGVKDQHGHVPGEDDHGQPGHGHRETPSFESIRHKVRSAAKAHDINYRILLDPENRIGVQFAAGELPTNIMIDGDGRVRRRFLGSRSLFALTGFVEELIGLGAPPVGKK